MLLAGKRILIVEDEPLIAIDLESAVVDQQGTVISAPSTLAEAQRVAENEAFDGAILDLHLKEGLALPVAESLLQRAIPFVIHSGHTDITTPRAWPMVPIIGKPALPEHVIAILASIIRK